MPIVIKASLSLGNALQGLNRLQRVLDATKAKTDALTQSLLAAGSAANGIGAGTTASSRGAVSTRTPSTRIGRPPDPFRNNPQAGANFYAQGAASGNVAAARLYGRYSGQYNSFVRNQSNAQNYLRFGGASNPNAALFAQALASTRFGRGGGQVLGHVATALSGTPGGARFLSTLMGAGSQGGAGNSAGAGTGGLGSFAGGLVGGALGGAAGAAVGQAVGQLVDQVVGKFIDAAKSGVEAMKQWNRAYAIGGGTMGQARSSNAIGSALGVDGSAIGASISGYGAAMLGLNPNTSPFGGDTNYNERFLALVRKIRNARSNSAARQIALINGHPELANVRGYSADAFRSLTNQPGNGFSGNQQLLEGAAGRLATAFQNLIATFSGPTVKLIASTFEYLASRMEFFYKVLTSILDMLPKKLQDAIGYDPNEAHRRSLDKNTDALDNNTAAQEGRSGGGARTASSVGRGYDNLSPQGRAAYRRLSYGLA